MLMQLVKYIGTLICPKHQKIAGTTRPHSWEEGLGRDMGALILTLSAFSSGLLGKSWVVFSLVT